MNITHVGIDLAKIVFQVHGVDARQGRIAQAIETVTGGVLFRPRPLIRAINAELSRTSDRQRLLQFARRWLYDHKQIIPRERELRGCIAKAIRQHEATLVSEIVEAIDPDLLARWRKTITQPRQDGATAELAVGRACEAFHAPDRSGIGADRAADLAQGRSAFG